MSGFNPNHKVVVISGANRGLGYEFTRQLIENETPPSDLLTEKNFCTEYTVVALTRKNDPKHWASLQEKTTSTRHLLPFECDVTNINQIKALVEMLTHKFNRVDIFISNAGIIEEHLGSSIELITDFSQDTIGLYNTNTIAPIVVTNHLMPLLENARKSMDSLVGGGSGQLPTEVETVPPTTYDTTIDPGVDLKNIDPNVKTPQYVQCLYVSSIMGSIDFINMPVAPTYRASKAALNMYVRALSFKYPKINFLPIHPGWVATDMGSRGGRTPPVVPVDSITGMFKQMNKYCNEQDNAMHLYSFDDQIIPW
jgi:NAD(P)-dependent dehydrogenase (short-subunit alcohol dehydrogenase family)